MPTHLLKAWPYGEWWMPAVSTDTSTLSGVASCWSFQLMTTWNQAHHVPLASSGGWTYARNQILWLTSVFWFKHSLAISEWTGRCCLYPQGTRDCKVFKKVRARYYCKTRWPWTGTFRWTVDAMRVFNTIWYPSGRHRWAAKLGALHATRVQDIIHVHLWLCSFGVKKETLVTSICTSTRGGGDLVSCFCLCRTSPSVDLRTQVPGPHTLVDSQLHQMHLMHPTWFNGAHHMWRKTHGGHSLTASIMLKRSPGSKVYRVPSSTIELPQQFFATCDSLTECGCLSRGMEPYEFTVIGVELPLAFATQ